jgi:hypothetical protein
LNPTLPGPLPPLPGPLLREEREIKVKGGEGENAKGGDGKGNTENYVAMWLRASTPDFWKGGESNDFVPASLW